MVKLASQDASASIAVAGWQARNGRLLYTSSVAEKGAKIKQPGRRLLPRSRTTLLLLDLMFLSGTIAGLIDGVRGRLGFESLLAAQAFIITMLVVSLALMFAAGCYRYDALTNFSAAVTRLVVALAVSTFILIPLIHFGLGLFFPSLAIRSLSREGTVIFLAQGAGITGGILSRLIFLAMARRHWFRRSILVVGTGKKAQYLQDLFSHEDRCLAHLHFLSEDHLGGRPSTDMAGKTVAALTQAQLMEEIDREPQIDQVVIAVDNPKGLQFDTLLPWKAEGIPVFDFASFLERETGRLNLTWTESDWLLYSEGFKFGLLDLVLKRVLDIVVSASFLLLTIPTFVLVALAVVFEDFGPVFYSQERVTQNGRSFRILKFRTMRVDAEKFGAQWACEKDPRITCVGHFLRRTRIDEIPQLINVLRGDMSLVGPRPERPVFVEKLSEEIPLYKLRHSMKAGVTGWAQINYPYGASVSDARNKLEFDLFYLKHFSVLRDVSIMLQTFRVLVFAQGGR
jgi:sugar transferase (PEP-CTERM system associated)